jgi:hypothetical protein
MADFVFNEWLWADLTGENGQDRQRETFRLLETILQTEDRLVVVRGSSFFEKAKLLWKHTDPLRRRLARHFTYQFLYNSGKCLLLDEDKLAPLSADVAAAIKDDDHYLVRALLTSKGEIIVTTDGDLIRALEDHGVSCRHRDEFVSEYLARHSRQ